VRLSELKLKGRSSSDAEAHAAAQTATTASLPDPQLTQRRDRLTEQFALMQSELGGLFYEMAIRDHVQLDVLVARAAALQRVDSELRQVELMLNEGAVIAGSCASCGTVYARGSVFCSQCAAPLPAA
jgi:hypothetical protein